MSLGLDPLDWPEVNRLLDEALALPVADRAAWLASLPGASARHRDTIARLLGTLSGVETDGMHSRMPGFDFPRDANASAGEEPGDRIGPYVLLSPLGQGGMGAVWLAERADALPRRKVALKLPHMGWAPGLAARLARERDILASLEHPNIARLYDAGVDPLGRPYLALEYVDGIPIDRYCAERSLDTTARLGLVLQVAAAVAHAHTRLVIHRDLKPSNILVAADGSVRLLDFGIAKLLQDGDAAEATELTRISGRAMTPDYASPEQIRGEAVGTAGDVYSLGVVAYELLTGLRPYRLGMARPFALARDLEAIVVPLPSRIAADPALRRELAGDLDAILNKALKKDAAERYQTVDAFADDLRRHLRNAPVQARPDSAAYRARKFMARHALQVGAAGVVALALIAGSSVALWRERAARLEAARAEEVKAFALSLFEAADAESAANAKPTVVDLLKVAGRRVEQELGARPETAVELMTSIGYSLLGHGEYESAAGLLAKAVALGDRTLGAAHPRAVAASVVYGEALIGAGRPKEAIPLLEETVARARRLDAIPDLVTGLGWLGSAHLMLGEVEAGLAAAQKSIAELEAHPGKLGKLAELQAYGKHANALHLAQAPGALEAAQRALAMTRATYGQQLNMPVMAARVQLAISLARAGRTAEAIGEMTSLSAEMSQLLGPDHPRIGMVAGLLGEAQMTAGQTAAAVDSYATAVRIGAKGGHGGTLGLTRVTWRLAGVLAADGRYAEALQQYDAAVKLTGDSTGPYVRIRQLARLGRTMTLIRLGRLDDAASELAALEADPGDPSLHQRALAALRSAQGRHAEAVEHATRAVQKLDPRAAKTIRADAQSLLGMALLGDGRSAEAAEALRGALGLYREVQLAPSPAQAEAASALERAERVSPSR